MHGIVAYTFLDVCEKFTSSCPVLKKMHTEETRFLSSASPCVECVALTEAMLLSGPPSVGDDSGQSRYQSLSSVQTVTGAQGRSHVLTGLLPGRLYAVAVAPYAESVDGAASNTVYLQTADDGTILYDTIRYEKLFQRAVES